MNAIAPYFKAVIAFIVPGVIALIAAISDGSDNGQKITGPEWVGIAAACILTSAGVWGVPNRDPRAQHQDESVQPPYKGRHEDGRGSLDTLGGILIALGAVLIVVDLLTTVTGLVWPGLILLVAGIVMVAVGRKHTTHA